MLSDVTTEFVRRHYAQGPTAYNADGSVVRMPTPADIEYAGQQFDRWLKSHDEAVRADMQREVRTVEDWSDPLGYTGFWTASRREHFHARGCDGTACEIMHPKSAPYVDPSPVTPSTPNQQGAEQ